MILLFRQLVVYVEYKYYNDDKGCFQTFYGGMI